MQVADKMKTTRNRRRQEGAVSGHQTSGWQIVYTGFILILLCFFIMLTSFASLQQSKITRFAQSFSDAVSVFSGGKSLEAGRTMIHADAMVVGKEDEMSELFEKVRRLGRQKHLNQVDMTRSRRGVVITFSEKLLFLSGEAELTAAAYPLLDKVGGIIKVVNVPVEIEGHTDDLAIKTAKFPSNWELSTSRAVAVLRYMIEKQNVDARQISAVGFSKYRPLVPNDSKAQRKRNRRVEIIFKSIGSHEG